MHVHHSNIDYIEKALSPYQVEIIHFVDPGLMYRVTSEKEFEERDAHHKVKEQIEWIASCQVDAILITCTHYIALLKEESLTVSVPILKIDEPFFESVCQIQQPQTILFSNPATVEGTMQRLNEYVETRKKTVGDIKVRVLDDTFEFFMKGLKEEYDQAISHALNGVAGTENRVLSVAQLSMVEGARQAEQQTGKTILNPLDSLISSLVQKLNL